MYLFGYFIGMARTKHTSWLVRTTNSEATTQAQRVVAPVQTRRSDNASLRNAQSPKADATFVDEEVRPSPSTRVVGGQEEEHHVHKPQGQFHMALEVEVEVVGARKPR